MRQLVSCAIVSLVLGAAAGASAADPQLMAPIKKFIDSFNKGDAAGAAATHSATADLAIVDEVPPHLWNGPKAFQSWSSDLEADAKKAGITEPAVTLGAAPTREESDGQTAYVVVPAVYTFKQNGKAMREKAQMTVVLKKDATGWLIHAWTWTGPKPTAAAGAAPAKPKP